MSVALQISMGVCLGSSEVIFLVVDLEGGIEWSSLEQSFHNLKVLFVHS